MELTIGISKASAGPSSSSSYEPVLCVAPKASRFGSAKGVVKSFMRSSRSSDVAALVLALVCFREPKRLDGGGEISLPLSRIQDDLVVRVVVQWVRTSSDVGSQHIAKGIWFPRFSSAPASRHGYSVAPAPLAQRCPRNAAGDTVAGSKG
eukprot:4363206-Prymnesium_polylepis.2